MFISGKYRPAVMGAPRRYCYRFRRRYVLEGVPDQNHQCYSPNHRLWNLFDVMPCHQPAPENLSPLGGWATWCFLFFFPPLLALKIVGSSLVCNCLPLEWVNDATAHTKWRRWWKQRASKLHSVRRCSSVRSSNISSPSLMCKSTAFAAVWTGWSGMQLCRYWFKVQLWVYASLWWPT